MGSIQTNNLQGLAGAQNGDQMNYEEELDRKLPSEMRHRPRIARTPAGEDKRVRQSSQILENSIAGSIVQDLPIEKKEKVKIKSPNI